ncbi:MAG: tetratricopeptide repeat protein [Myxococcota bacterium]
MTDSRARAAIAALLAVATLWLYAPVRRLPFLRYDDEQYVTANAAVQGGLSLAGARWAFTTYHASNWHPLTWLSHMLDTSAFGSSAAGPHVENALLHALNSVLVFALLAGLTGAVGRSALAALLFAVHPQHVESVAWIAERKDLLCALFGLASLVAWCRYARAESAVAYAAALACMALGLLAKPMLVSLPLLLLVLDYWPLARPLRRRLLLEKLPFAALSLAASVVTLRAQVSAMQLDVALPDRLANACVAVAATLGQSLVPIRLAVLYPHPGHWPIADIAGALGFVAALGGLAFALRRRAPYLLAGGVWFGVGLAPTLGLVQVGFQSHADRYAYLPQLGVLWAVVWGLADPLARARAPRAVGVALAAAAVLALAAGTRKQLEYWESDVALWQRAVAIAGPSYYAETELGIELGAAGHFPESLPHFARAVELNPRWPRAQASYGFALFLTGDPVAATQRFERALEIEPNPTAATEWHLYYARALAAAGRPSEAVTHYQKQLELDPDDRGSLFGLAEIRATEPEPPLRDGAEALRLARRACELIKGCVRPEEIDILALAVAAAGDPASAARVAEKALTRARAIGDAETAARIERHLERFRNGLAVVDPSQ